MDIKQINTAIIAGSWTNDEINSMIDAIKYARAQLSKTVKYTFKVGAPVQFRSKTGRVYSGTVTKILQKNILVKTPTATYRVPANMLEAAA